MRVVLVSHVGLPHVGGIEVIVEQEIDALVQAGHTVVHVTSNADGAAEPPTVSSEVERIRVPAWRVVERRAHIGYPLFGPALVKALRREIARADVVHAHGFVYETTVVAFGLASRAGVPRILTDHAAIQTYHSLAATMAARAAAQTVGRASCYLADRIIAYNDRILDTLVHLARPHRPDARFIPYPVRPIFRPTSDEERLKARRQLGVLDETPIVLFVGRFNPDKGADLVAALGDDTSLKVVICGPGDRRVLGRVPAGVDVLPPTDTAGVLRLYHASDVVVAPTVPGREGFPLVVREALAAGTPVVSTYEDGYRRYRGLPGLHFVDRTIPSIRAGVREALDSTPLVSTSDPVLSPTPAAWVQSIYGGLIGEECR
jgi:glycosyltransferase involved in cell wall biosynthesis